MSKHWQTEILTTCALEYTTWENHYPAGTEEVDGALIRRFLVDHPRDAKTFDRLSGPLSVQLGHAPLSKQEQWMRAQGPMSTPLFDFLAAHRDEYDAFIFFGYLYATTYYGLPLVREKAFLAPLAHDEWPIYLSMWDRLFAQPRALIFNTAAEREFLRQRFPTVRADGPVIGVGIEPPAETAGSEFRERYELAEPFLLYVGRVDAAKGCATLFEYFQRARADGALKHKLVLIGREVMPIPFDENILHLGFLPDEEKWGALSACDWLMMPSPNESLSMALLEAWIVGRPALVNAACDVLVAHCRAAHGGLWYRDYEEWLSALSFGDGKLLQALGRNARAYVEREYSWKRVESDYLRCIAPVGDSQR